MADTFSAVSMNVMRYVAGGSREHCERCSTVWVLSVHCHMGSSSENLHVRLAPVHVCSSSVRHCHSKYGSNESTANDSESGSNSLSGTDFKYSVQVDHIVCCGYSLSGSKESLKLFLDLNRFTGGL